MDVRPSTYLFVVLINLSRVYFHGRQGIAKAPASLFITKTPTHRNDRHTVVVFPATAATDAASPARASDSAVEGGNLRADQLHQIPVKVIFRYLKKK